MWVTDQYSICDPDIPSNDADGHNNAENEQHTIELHVSYIDNIANKMLSLQKELLK